MPANRKPPHLRLTLALLGLLLTALAGGAQAQGLGSLFEGLGNLLKQPPAAGSEAKDKAPPQPEAEPANTRGLDNSRNLVVAPGGKRRALVIGNDNYQSVSKLQKAGNDARAMARELKAAGFEVIEHRDLNYKEMIKAVDLFADSITGGDQVVVFFAGHGVQLRTGSYLLPVDIEANNEGQVEKTSYGLGELTDKLNEARAAFALVLVDACRDNPLKSRGRSIGNARGLSAIEPPKGQMVVYSASKGQQALDRLSDADSNPNGVFTREFIKRMRQPGVTIESMVREVQDAVESLAKSVNHEQRPALYNEARGNFYFFGPTTVNTQSAPAPAQPRSAEEIEDGYWDSIKSDRHAASFEDYLKQYPQGRYAPLARAAINRLKAEADKPAGALASPRPAPAAQAANPEDAMWAEVKASGSKEYYDAYLKQYAKGKYAALARVELKRISDQEAAQKAQEEQQAWEQAKTGNSVESYAAFVSAYPRSANAVLAQAAQERLKREAADKERLAVAQREREARDATLREEAELWSRAQNSSAQVQAYLDRYPTGRYAAAANQRLAQLKREEAELRPGKVFKDCADCPEMVVIPAGSFMMGGSAGDEAPAHNVALGKPFALGKTEVTRGQFVAFVNASGYRTEAEQGDGCFGWTGSKWEKQTSFNWRNLGFAQTDDHPVACVSWNDAQAYARWLNQKTGKQYRLPSEAEWEYACRAGGRHEYCGSDDVNAVGWYGGFSGNGTSGKNTNPVARKQANAFGLHDMSGNVWEWVQDTYHDNYQGAPTDGSAWEGGGRTLRVLRGGSWVNYPQVTRAAFRNRNSPVLRLNDIGFRLARMLP